MTTLSDPTSPAPLVRVERGGGLTTDELAALTVVLLHLAGAQDFGTTDPPDTPATARWERPERHPAYRFPGSWRGGPRTGDRPGRAFP